MVSRRDFISAASIPLALSLPSAIPSQPLPKPDLERLRLIADFVDAAFPERAWPDSRKTYADWEVRMRRLWHNKVYLSSEPVRLVGLTDKMLVGD